MNRSQLEADLKAIVAAFFAVNVRGMLEEPSRLDAVARLAGVPPERVPAVREALTLASREGLQS